MDLVQEFPAFRVEDIRNIFRVGLDLFLDFFQRLVICLDGLLKTFHLSTRFTMCADVPKWNRIFTDGAMNCVVGHEHRSGFFSFA